jgi:adenine-specific DNA-methyltransferase
MARPNYRDLTQEQLISLLEARDRKKFGLVWERDAIEYDRALNSDFVVFDEVPELGAGEGTKPNLIIEGDNFDALRALRVAYAGKVKCIYIDPPYNTGNRDFVYNDRFVDKDHNWRHSLWLEFMFQRLTLARDLLAQDGAIFVSIDDNEIFHLGLLMNEVFGEGNFVANFLWRRRTTPDSRNLNGISADHDFILAYQRGGGFSVSGKAKDLTKYQNPDKDERGSWMSDNLTGLADAKDRPNLHYQVVNPETGVSYEPHPGRGWSCGRERMSMLIRENRILWPKSETGRPRLKRFITDMASNTTGLSTFLDAPGNTAATREISAILGPKAFTFPKPHALLMHLFEQATNPGDLILDFFAGSGTTGHAVLKMNAANPDLAPRRFILVSNTEATEQEPDKNLCRDVCRQRVANVISGYGDVPGTGGAFAYLRTRRIPMMRVVRRIEHTQVWLFLQLMHFGDLAAEAPLASGRLHARRVPEQAVFYLTTLTEAILQRLEKECENAANVTIYTWQPEALATRMESPGISILPIPQTLIDRFGPRP